MKQLISKTFDIHLKQQTTVSQWESNQQNVQYTMDMDACRKCHGLDL